MRKRVLPALLVAFLLSACASHAQVRGLVAIVSPTYPASLTDFANALAAAMNLEGFRDVGDALRGFSKGAFGSGFVYVAPGGENYVITNRHVIAHASRAVVAFENDDGSRTEYKDCPVVAEDDALDLAILALPPGPRPFAHGLPLSDVILRDGTEVWSAGFPGLAGEPLWQLGKGTVTNALARIPDLVDPARTTLLQHSAPTDPGNSGGPLLVQSEDSPVGYAVVGVNTWKALRRQAATFATPTGALRGFLDAALRRAEETGQADRDVLESRGRDFVNALSSADRGYARAARFISDAYVEREGRACLSQVLHGAPEEVRSEILGQLLLSSPVEAVQMAIAYSISTKGPRQTFSSSTAVAVPASFDGSGSSPVAVGLANGAQVVTTRWVREQGQWRVVSFVLGTPALSADKETQAPPPASLVKSPYEALLTVGASLGLEGAGGPLVEATGMANVAPFLSLGASLFAGSISFQPGEDVGTIGLSAAALFQVPFVLASLNVIPYVAFRGGLDFSLTATSPGDDMFASLRPGIMVGMGQKSRFYVGLECRFDSYAFHGFQSTWVSLIGGISMDGAPDVGLLGSSP